MLENESSDSADGIVFLARTINQSITDDRALVSAIHCLGVDSHELIGLKKMVNELLCNFHVEEGWCCLQF